MYSRDAWGGAVVPHILVKFIKDTAEDDSDPITSMVIFEWKDYDLIGVLPTADSITVFDWRKCYFPRVYTHSLYRKNTSAIPNQSKTNSVMSTKLESLSWQRMRRRFRRT